MLRPRLLRTPNHGTLILIVICLITPLPPHCFSSWEVDLDAGPLPDGTPRIIDRTCLRQLDERDPTMPFWAPVRWLQSQAEWTINRLKDRCAIVLGGNKQPRAALICFPVGGSTFTVTTVVSAHDCDITGKV